MSWLLQGGEFCEVSQELDFKRATTSTQESNIERASGSTIIRPRPHVELLSPLSSQAYES